MNGTSHPRRRRAGAWLGSLGLTWVLVFAAPSAVTRAADDSNIPGVPLPASVVTGQLGGPIYDHVYSIDIPAQRVVLISLIGDPGTDFDLYLFNSSATNVQSTQGQVATSKGPTSSESIAYTVVGADRFYIDLNGATAVQGGFRLTVQVLQDRTPPRAALVLEGGAPATTSPAVSATVVATDDLAGIADMQFSTDGTNWLPWQVYVPTILWSFPSSDGPIQLWARVRDRAGNVSGIANATIVLDRVAPTVVRVDPPAGAATAGLQPEIRVTFSEPIVASSWTTVGLLLQDPTGVVAYGTYTLDASRTVGTFRPSSPLSAGTTYLVTIGSVVDAAGNRVLPMPSWTVRPLALPSLSIKASASVVSPGATVQVTGSIEGRAGAAVVLEQSIAGGPWEATTVALDGGASLRTTVVALVNTSLRLHYIGNDVSAEAYSPVVRILVRRGVSLAGISTSTTRVSAVGRTNSLTATLGPNAPQVAVTLQIYRYDPVRRAYLLRSSISRTSVSGKAIFAWRPSIAGRYLLRLTTLPTAAYANGISAAYRWDIR